MFKKFVVGGKDKTEFANSRASHIVTFKFETDGKNIFIIFTGLEGKHLLKMDNNNKFSFEINSSDNCVKYTCSFSSPGNCLLTMVDSGKAEQNYESESEAALTLQSP